MYAKTNNILAVSTLSLLFLLSLATQAQEPNNTPIFEVSSGKLIHYEDFPSSYIPERNVEVWLPEAFSTEQRYPVLYMHDGQMLFDASKTWNKQEWGIDEIISKSIEQGSIPPVIIVGIWNISEKRHSEYFPEKPFESLHPVTQDSLVNEVRRNEHTDLFSDQPYSDRYLKFISEELKPFIDRNYPTLSAREHTFIAGSSMGGLISMYALCEYPEVFGGAACISTHWPGVFQLENNPIPEAFLTYLKDHIPDPDTHKIYFDHGTATLDALYGENQLEVNAIFKGQGYDETNFLSRVFQDADHSEKSWSKRLDVPLKFLLD